MLEVWRVYLKKGRVHISAQRVPSITGSEPGHQCPIEFTVFRACSVPQYISTKIQLMYPVETALEKNKFDELKIRRNDYLSEPSG